MFLARTACQTWAHFAKVTTDLNRVELLSIESFKELDGACLFPELNDNHRSIRRDVSDESKVLYALYRGRDKG